MHLTFLGTGAGCGVPSIYCDCAACQEARSEPRLRRSRCGVIVQGAETLLIDAPPELREQLLRVGINDIDRFVLTHWHYDHFGGIGDLEFYVRMKRNEALPTVMSEVTRQAFLQGFDFMADCLAISPVEDGSTWELADATCTFLQAQHAPGTLGVLLQQAGRRTAYFPDTGPLPPHIAKQLRGVDTLILDATFWRNNWMPEQHQSVQSAIETGLALEAKRIYLTHLSMHYDSPVTDQELMTFLRQFGDQIQLAYDGQRIEI